TETAATSRTPNAAAASTQPRGRRPAPPCGYGGRAGPDGARGIDGVVLAWPVPRVVLVGTALSSTNGWGADVGRMGGADAGGAVVVAVSTTCRSPTSRSTGSGSQPSPTPGPTAGIAASAAMTSPGAGRYRGSLARHRATISRTGCGTSFSVGSAYTTRYASASVRPSPNGPRPVAAKVSTAPSAKTSAAGPVSPPAICSGAMNPAEPRIGPALGRELCSAARA